MTTKTTEQLQDILTAGGSLSVDAKRGAVKLTSLIAAVRQAPKGTVLRIRDADAHLTTDNMVSLAKLAPGRVEFEVE